MRFGAGNGEHGTVLLLTLGTGIGSALFIDGILVPNTEFGHIQIRGKDAEKRASELVREEQGLSWEKWAARVDEYLAEDGSTAVSQPDHHRRRRQQEGRQVRAAPDRPAGEAGAGGAPQRRGNRRCRDVSCGLTATINVTHSDAAVTIRRVRGPRQAQRRSAPLAVVAITALATAAGLVGADRLAPAAAQATSAQLATAQVARAQTATAQEATAREATAQEATAQEATGAAATGRVIIAGTHPSWAFPSRQVASPATTLPVTARVYLARP